MLVILGLLGGGTWGGLLARRRDGNGKDIAQYAAAYGIAWGLIGLILTIIIERLA